MNSERRTTSLSTETASVILSGLAVSGRGIAAGMIDVNKEAIGRILGSEPYPGTMNVVVNAPFILRHAQTMDAKGKMFGVRGIIDGTPCVVYRFHGAPLHVVEIISSVHLRTALGLKDGQTVRITIPKETVAQPAAWRLRLWKQFYDARPVAYYDDGLHKKFTRWGLKFFHKKVCQFKKEFR
jgi:hypothetical protein